MKEKGIAIVRVSTCMIVHVVYDDWKNKHMQQTARSLVIIINFKSVVMDIRPRAVVSGQQIRSTLGESIFYCNRAHTY